jgi:hypothetical protein
MFSFICSVVLMFLTSTWVRHSNPKFYTLLSSWCNNESTHTQDKFSMVKPCKCRILLKFQHEGKMHACELVTFTKCMDISCVVTQHVFVQCGVPHISIHMNIWCVVMKHVFELSVVYPLPCNTLLRNACVMRESTSCLIFMACYLTLLKVIAVHSGIPEWRRACQVCLTDIFLMLFFKSL